MAGGKIQQDINGCRTLFANKRPKEWDLYVPQVAAALRALVNRQTGFTANKLMLGREVVVSADLVFSHVRRSRVCSAIRAGHARGSRHCKTDPEAERSYSQATVRH